MLQIHYVHQNKDEVINKLNKRGVKNAESAINELIDIDNKRKQAQSESDKAQAEANQKAKEIGKLKAQGKQEEFEKAKQTTAELKQKTKELSALQHEYEQKLKDGLLELPNLPHDSVPEGNSDEANEIVSEHGQMPKLFDKAKPHWDLIKDLDIIDFELGNKITGAGFPVYKGKGAKLQRALINFFLDEAQNMGYEEVQPPLLINADSGLGTGQLPDKDGQMYHMEIDKYYLIPTAEVPITNIYRDVILSEEELPIKKVGYTPCFRREAGSWGADVRGLNRLHQFDKVEIVQIQKPEKSYEVLEEMCEYVKSLLEKLELPYRVLRLCAGDLGFTSALTFDMEVYSAAQKRWLEVSSVSNFETYQATRLNLKYKDENKKKHFLHTLNGSALALPRIVATLIENNQTSEGKIKIPKVLQSYTRFEEI